LAGFDALDVVDVATGALRAGQVDVVEVEPTPDSKAGQRIGLADAAE